MSGDFPQVVSDLDVNKTMNLVLSFNFNRRCEKVNISDSQKIGSILSGVKIMR